MDHLTMTELRRRGRAGSSDMSDMDDPATAGNTAPPSGDESLPPDFEDHTRPVREPLHFDITPEDYPPDMAGVIMDIKKLAETLLFHWQSFPIVLPSSITQRGSDNDDDTQSGGGVSFRDLFIAPTFDELEQVASAGTSDGSARKLDAQQLEAIRRTGEFSVASLHFPGQEHRWRLSVLLQLGTERAHSALLDDLATALRLLVVTATNRFRSHYFSLSQAAKAMGRAAWMLLDMLVGLPSTSSGDLDEKLYLEHMRFLVAELDIKPSCQREWLRFIEHVKAASSSRPGDSATGTIPTAPHRFLTPQGADVDLRLFNRDIMAQCTPLLKAILERESKSWYIKYKDHIISRLKGQNLSYKEITERVNEAIKEEYLRRVFEAVLASPDLEAVQQNIGKLLVEQARSVLIMQRSLDAVSSKMSTQLTSLVTRLTAAFPVRARIKPWLNSQCDAFRREFVAVNRWGAHEASITSCREAGLSQATYFLSRDLTFMRDRERVLARELSRVRHPTRVFTFRMRVWLPRRYVVTRHDPCGCGVSGAGDGDHLPTGGGGGSTDVVVETRISREEAPPPPTRADDGDGAEAVRYSVSRFRVHKTSTRYPLWRWHCFLLRAVCWSWEAAFWLGVVLPWCSPVSLRALFYTRPFTPDLQLDTRTGILHPKPSSRTHTLLSRLQAIWSHVRESREKFETAPDTGLLGKSFTRQLNRVWLYGVVGGLGSALLVLGFSPLCLLASTAGVIAAVTTPIWMPVVTLIVHLVCIIAYDIDHPTSRNAILYLFEALFYRLLLQGILQPIAALITALILLPAASAVITLYAVVKRGCRGVWDAFMFHAIIKKRARVPSSNTFVARRIAGPGLASNYFYQVHPEQVLAAVESRIELHELTAWADTVARAIDLPKREYRKLVECVFGPFSGGLVPTAGVYQQMTRELTELHDTLHKKVEARRQKLSTGLTADIQSRIKLSSRELKVIVAQTAKLLASYYPARVLARLPHDEAAFWEGKHLEAGDWQGLATQLLTDVFSTGFLTPLEETDTCFKLELSHLNLSRYLEMLKSAEFRDDLAVVSTVHTPKGDIDVDAPYFEVHHFSPVRQDIHYAEFFTASRIPEYDFKGHVSRTQRRGKRRWPWKRKGPALNFDPQLQKLDVPLPIAHPVVVAVLIHNRGNDVDEIRLDSACVSRVLDRCQQPTAKP